MEIGWTLVYGHRFNVARGEVRRRIRISRKTASRRRLPGNFEGRPIPRFYEPRRVLHAVAEIGSFGIGWVVLMQPQSRYTILGEIAAGGTATVFLAEDSVLRRKVALKKLHPHLINHPEMVKRFRKEAVAVASLSHENVIKIFDYGQEDKVVYLAMEYVDGLSLDALLHESKGVIPNLTALSIFQQLLEGLTAAHALGICHRDIKPSNVLIDRKGNVRLADFGIAFLSEETSFTRTGAYLGTPGFSAPEQAEGKPITEKTDIFAAGAMLYRCLAGRMPFVAGSPHAVLKAIVEQAQPKASLVNPRIVPALADLAQDMLAKEPTQRPSAQACARRVQEIARELGLPIDAGRIQALLADADAQSAREGQELSERFAQMARRAEQAGKGREALKLYSLAQVFSSDGLKGRDASLRLRSALRRTRWAGAMAAAAFLIATGAMALRAHPKGPPPAGPAAFGHAAPASEASLIAAALPIPGLPGNRPEPMAALMTSASPAARRNGSRTRTAARTRPAGHPLPTPAEEKDASASRPAQGYAWIKTNPPFARIRIDGKEIGSTPLPAPMALAEGAHSLEVEREGCRPLAREFRVPPADTLVLRLTLEREGVP